MKVSVMQPNLFMWPGLLKTILQSELHIVLDSVPASKNSRYNRNKICGSGGERWLTVPFCNFSRNLTIDKLRVDSSTENILSLENIFSNRYANASFLSESLSLITGLKNSRSSSLCDIYVAFLDSLSALNFELPPIIFSSKLKNLDDLDSPKLKGAYLIDNILREVNATTYLAAQNVQSYSSPDDYSVNKVLFQRFTPLPYQQYCKGRLDSAFIPFLSVLDIIASIGVSRTHSYMNSCNEWT